MNLPEFLTEKYKLRKNFDLSKTNWFRVGGCAQYFFKPENAADLSEFLQELPLEIPVTILGVGSNVIIRDGGIDGVVVKLGRGFADCSLSPLPIGGRVREGGYNIVEGGYTPHSKLQTLIVGAGTLDLNAARFAAENSIAGLEFLSGIPGTIGGAVRMNAGAYGSDISQILLSAEIVGRDGKIKNLSADELKFSYRKNGLSEGDIVTSVVLQGKPGDKQEILQRMDEIAKSREESQPIRSRTGGSTFKNPEGNKAWELIDKAGCRGLTIGGAQMSEQHCNFMINTGGATAADLENLGDEVIKRVYEKTGVMLEWEIKRIGKFLDL